MRAPRRPSQIVARAELAALAAATSRLALGLALGWALSFSLGCERGDPEPRANDVPSEPREAQPPDSRSEVPALIFLGDSLTAGRGLSRDQALPALIQARIDAAGLDYRVVNAGRSGDTTAGGLARLDWYFDSSPAVAGLVIGLGSNDAMRGLSIEAMERNLSEIARRTRERFPDAKIFLWALETFPNLGPEYASRYARVFPKLAEREHLVLLPFPLAEVAGRPELNQPDGIHPTAEGTRRVAARVWETLRSHL